LPELANETLGLVLDADVIAAIYLNQLTMWNDSRIQTLNPDLAARLPGRSIKVVLENGTAVQELFTYWLNASVPSWSSLVLVPAHFAI
jgi:ABC-type phosphate transport system substrate-binding protein